MINAAKDQTTMKTLKCKVLKCEQTKKSIWFNKELEKEIKLRKKYNREKRNENDVTKKSILDEKYNAQKRKTQNLIKNEITKHERKVTNDIRKDKGNKKLWDVVNILRGKGNLRKLMQTYKMRKMR